MVLAGLYYLMSVLLATSGFGYLLTAFSLPFIIFGIVDVIKKKRNGLPAGRNLISVLLALLVFIAGSAMTPDTRDGNLQSGKTAESTTIAANGTTQGINEEASPITPEQSISAVPQGQSATREKAGVARVIDGDTFELENGKRVRLIGIDTPESVSPDQSKNTEFGKLASAFTKEKLEGKTVYLEKDVSETDQYGRLLRYAYLEDGTFYNEYLVKEGMANPSTYPPDVKYADVFVKAQQYAEANNKGLWALAGWNGANTVPTPTAGPGKNTGSGSNSGGSDTNADAGGHGLIKGNINSQGEKIYHVPGGAYYDKTNPEAWFKTEKEAQAAGYRRSKR